MTTLDSIRTALDEIAEDPNDYATGVEGWEAWQDRAEGLAELVTKLLHEQGTFATEDDDPNALTWAGIPHDSTAFQVEQGSHGTADWRESPEGIPASARLERTVARVYDADDWALGVLHAGTVAEVWAVTTGGEFRLYSVTR